MKNYGPPIEILWIEDNLGDQRLIREFFDWGSKRCRITFLEDGEKALHHLFADETLSRLPDLIVVDLNLPRKDGKEVIVQLKKSEKTSRIPLVAFTSSSNESDVTFCYEWHASGYLRKPADLDEYRDTLKAIRDYWVNNVLLPKPVFLAPKTIASTL